MRAQLWDLYFLNDPEAAYERLQRDFYRLPPLEKDYLQALSYRRLQFKEGLLTDDPKKREITLENLKLIREAQWGKNIRVGDLALLVPEDSLCEPDSVNSLVNKIKSKIGSNKNQGYRRIAVGYSWRNIAKKLDAIIRRN